MVLGFDAVKRFVLTVSMKGFFGRRCGSICCAGSGVTVWPAPWFARSLPRRVPTPRSETIGPTPRGLLHDIGRLGLFVVHPQEYADLLTAPPADGDFLERERQAFGVDHCQAGAWLATRWGLPDDVRKVAAGHHNPPNMPAVDHKSATEYALEDLVRVGVLLTDSLGFDVAPPWQPRTIQEVRSLLPRAAQYRFDPDPVAMKARITGILDAFD